MWKGYNSYIGRNVQIKGFIKFKIGEITMKIVCTKEEFTEMVVTCDPCENECYGCVLQGVCDGKKHLVKMCDIEEEIDE